MMKLTIMLDSGAFTVWRQGGSIDLDAYIAFIKRHRELITAYICADVIPGEYTHAAAAEATYDNLQRMKDAGLSPIPVFHRGESFDWLYRLLEDGEPRIALAPNSIRPKVYLPWLEECWSRLQHQPIRLHALGLAASSSLQRFRWSSADSGTWFAAAGQGRIPVPILVDRNRYDYTLTADNIFVTADTRHHRQHIDWLDPIRRQIVLAYLHDVVRVELDQLARSLDARQRCWVWFYSRLAVALGLDFYFTTTVCGAKERDVLNEGKARRRLLSYAKLRQVPERTFVDYVAQSSSMLNGDRRQ
jgi:hypothetical protein